MLPESFAPSGRWANGCTTAVVQRVPPLPREALSLYKETINTRYGLLGPMPSSEAHRGASGAGRGSNGLRNESSP